MEVVQKYFKGVDYAVIIVIQFWRLFVKGIVRPEKRGGDRGSNKVLTCDRAVPGVRTINPPPPLHPEVVGCRVFVVIVNLCNWFLISECQLNLLTDGTVGCCCSLPAVWWSVVYYQMSLPDVFVSDDSVVQYQIFIINLCLLFFYGCCLLVVACRLQFLCLFCCVRLLVVSIACWLSAVVDCRCLY